MTEVKNNFVQKVCEITGEDYESAKKKMDHTRKVLGILYGEYFNNKFYELTYTEQKVESRRIIIRRNNRNARFDKINAATGWSRPEIRQKIKEINDKNIFNMTLILYAKYEAYRYEGEELDAFLKLMADRLVLKNQLLSKFEQIDKGEAEYAETADLLKRFYLLIEKLMPESLVDMWIEELGPSHPELKDDRTAGIKAAVKMEVIRVLFPFSAMEYVAFDFHEKSIEEIREFITDKERMRILNAINDPSCFDILDNKIETYSRFKQYYGREMISVTSESDYGIFEEFCKKNRRIVVKPPCETQGRGIRAICIDEYESEKEVFDMLIDDHGEFMVEELIVAHEAIKKLNPDSVNTVRMITYFDGEKSIIHSTFMKVGQKGCFIDNGGAGGILVSIDPVTGRFDSDGRDERGVRYEKHPYTGTKFMGYQLPDWEKARTLGLELSDKVPGLRYIGWDLTYTAENEWVIVEGNAKTQFVGQQCTKGKGVRKDFIETVNYKE